MRLIALASLFVLLSVPALAAVDDACWYRDAEEIDHVTDPPQGGDNQFFTASQVAPNLIWILDTSGSMMEEPCSTGNGCGEYSRCNGGFQALGNDYFTSRGYKGFFDPTDTDRTNAYDAFDPDFCNTPGDARSYSGKDGCYKPGVVYEGSNCNWRSGGVWTYAGSSEANSTILNWCASHFNGFPPNPASSPHSCTKDSDCGTGYTCQDPTGTSGSKACYLPVDCTVTGYVCPATFTCDTTTKHCESGSGVVTPPNPYDEFDTCSRDSQCPGGYVCRRSDGRSFGSNRKCYLEYTWDGNCRGDTCPSTYTCNQTSGDCEKSVTVSAPLQSGTSTCSADTDCQQGYRCTTDAGATTGSNRHCRLPVEDCQTTGYTCPGGSQYSCNTTDHVCESSALAACITNLETYGYYDGGSIDDPVFTGDLLNFSPPKFVTARKVLKDVVPEVQKTRQALFTFNASSGFGKLQANLGPTCDKFNVDGQWVMPADSDFSANATSITSLINGLVFNGGTPLAGSLTSACQDLTSDYNRFKNQVKVHTTTGVGGGDSSLSSRSGDDDAICQTCQKNFVVVVTDGEPDGDTSVPSRLRTYGGLDSSYFDDVANFCHTEDLRPDLSNLQNATIDTIGFGLHSQTLEDAADLGGGVNLAADDAAQLRDALAQVIADVNKRATSFSVASVTTVQTRGSTYAFVPRFRPSTEKLWEGHLYRFKLFNEFAAGCSPNDTVAPMTADKLSRNPNGNASCDDIYLMDANDQFVQEDSDGNYMVADTTQAWTADDGWPLKVPNTPATPVWDAADALQTRSPTTDPRNILTVIDTDADGSVEPGEEVAFTEANVDELLPYLALGGVDGEACTAIAQSLNMTGTFATEHDCAVQVVRFVRGLDIFDENKNGQTTDVKPKVLGDIFHSSPILVTAPVPSYLCDLGVTTQCLFSLYGPQLTPNGQTAYDAFATAQAQRQQEVIVGSNDGMIHAFDAGTFTSGVLGLGTGRELWAFIPPDVLPKLKRMFVPDAHHELMVDGTAMVRDVWVDAENPGQKDADEFHTMAIVGERQGGRSWTALDITDPTTPKFRWTWPPPGSRAALQAGDSWDDFAPGAPPIGPIAVKDANGPLARGTTHFKEDWAVFLNGGYDSALTRGASVDALDVWTGKPLWRFARADATDSADPRASLGPVASPVTILDLGPNGTSRGLQDGLFDTAVFPDITGQVFVAHLYDPADDTDGDGLADNWFGARTFVEHKGDALSTRSPFFQLAEATVDPGTGNVRVYVGGGNRENIRDLEGGECSFDNLQACLRKGCSVTATPNRVDQSGHYLENTWSAASGATSITQTSYAADSAAASLACADETKSSYQVAVSCPNGTTPLTATWSDSVDCNWSQTAGAVCAETPKEDPFFTTLRFPATTTNARFYAFNLFDSTRAPFSSLADAETYDAAALTDTDLGDADTTPLTGTTDPDGYYVTYGLQDERTSSSATILGGCVYWNTLKPDASPVACGSKVADEARLYRANYSTGSEACGSITDPTGRSTERTAIVPPPPPTPVVSMNPTTGEVHYSMVAVEPGVPPSQVNVGAGQLAGTVYWMEVPRKVHECRHGTGTCR